jgi:hypothetical protein
MICENPSLPNLIRVLIYQLLPYIINSYRLVIHGDIINSYTLVIHGDIINSYTW